MCWCSSIHAGRKLRIHLLISSSDPRSTEKTTVLPIKKAVRHLVGLVPPPPTYYAASTQPGVCLIALTCEVTLFKSERASYAAKPRV